MKNIQYDSFHKFITSIGIIILIIPFAFLYFIYSNNSNILITRESFNDMTNTSREIITLKQDAILFFLKDSRLFLLALLIMIFGITILYYGLNSWRKVQVDLDDKVKLDNTKTRKEIEKLSSIEAIDKKEAETLDDRKILGQKGYSSTLALNYIKVEAEVANAIKKQLPDTYEVIEQAVINNTIYDILVISEEDLNDDYIIEVKYIKDKINNNFVLKIINRLKEQSEEYFQYSGKKAKKRVIFVIESKEISTIKSKILAANKILNKEEIIMVSNEEVKNIKIVE